jgi:hypothetical protein
MSDRAFIMTTKEAEMNLPLDPVRNRRVEAAKAFAEHFTHFEWEYLCSYQWFLTGMDHALETGNFAQLAPRADKTLVDDKIRRCSKTNKESKRVASRLG